MDVDGLDSACKLVIMANWIMNRKVTLRDVEVEGIRDITMERLQEAARRGHTIKLLGTIDGGLTVRPKEVDRHDPLCVGGALNAVTLVSDSAGEQTIIGRGAGGKETASAILRDLLSINQRLSRRGIFPSSGW
jgi:homoserine dehydrogenase